MENEMDNTESLNSEENLDSNQETTNESVETTDEGTNEELTKAQQMALNQKIRAEKAEKELKRLKALGVSNVKKEEEPSKSSLSAKDIIAIRDLHEEDAEYLLEESQLRKKTVSDLKKDPYYKAILQVRAEERKSADATHSGKSRTSASKLTSEQIVEMSRSGKLTDGAELARAEMDLLRSKK